jgi:energy-coupling factor transporter ATP-binding protein EcfA2
MDGRGLLLDEPTCALDPETKEAVRELVAGRSRSGTTVAMATHSMEEAAEADLVAVFDRGRLAALCDPETLFYDRFDPLWGIGRPFAVRVAAALASLGVTLRSRPLTVDALEGELAAALL